MTGRCTYLKEKQRENRESKLRPKMFTCRSKKGGSLVVLLKKKQCFELLQLRPKISSARDVKLLRRSSNCMTLCHTVGRVKK